MANNNRRRGGFTREQRTWIKNRDGNKCALCDSQESLEVHHLIPFRYSLTVLKTPIYLVNSPTNGITLCKVCHSGTNESIHPDMAMAHRVYHSDKSAYSRVFADRDELCRERKPYWFSGHDDWFKEVALRRTMAYLLETGIPWPENERK